MRLHHAAVFLGERGGRAALFSNPSTKMPRVQSPHGHAYEAGTSYSMATQATQAVSPHFRVFEFACHDGSDEVLIHPALPHLLEAIREACGGKSVHINSGYRTPAYNQGIGGATNSRHKTGQAADIVIRGLSPAQVRKIAKDANPGGLGGYKTFTHVDVQGLYRRWGLR